MNPKILITICLAFLPLTGVAQEKEACDNSCKIEIEALERVRPLVLSLAPQKRTAAVDHVTFEIQSSPYVKVWVTALDILEDVVKAGPAYTADKERVADSFILIAQNTSHDSVKVKVLENFSPLLSDFSVGLRVSAVNGIKDIAIQSQSDLIISKSVEILSEVLQKSWLPLVRLTCIDAIKDIAVTSKRREIVRKALERLSESQSSWVPDIRDHAKAAVDQIRSINN